MSRFNDPKVALRFLKERHTYEEIAERVAVHYTTLWRIENSTAEPREIVRRALKNAAIEEQKKRRRATREARSR